MKLLRLSFKGITRFQSPVSIDFDSLGEGLIAVVGANGAGKTTLVEAPAVAIFKSFPTRPKFYENFHGRDAFVEAVFQDGAGDPADEISVRLAVDATARKTEGYILKNGAPLTDGKAAGFDASIKEYFGSLTLFLASVFASQSKAGNFLGMARTDRKGLFVELLGLGVLEVLSASARDREAQGQAALSGQRALAGAEQEASAELPALREQVAGLQVSADAAAKALDDARAEEASAISANERAKTALERIGHLVRLESQARSAVLDVERRQEATTGTFQAVAKTRSEKTRFVDGRKAGEMEPTAREAHADKLAALALRKGAIDARRAGLPDEVETRDRLQALEVSRAEVVAIAGIIERADRAVADAKKEESRVECLLAALVNGQDSERRALQKLAAVLDEVPCLTEAPEITSRCPLIEEAIRARATLAVPAPALEGQAWSDARAAHSAARRARSLLPTEADDPATFDAEITALRNALARIDASAHDADALVAIEAERTHADATLADAITAATTAREQSASDLIDIETEYGLAVAAYNADTKAEAEALHAAEHEHEAAVETLRAARAESPAAQTEADLSRATVTRKTAEQLLTNHSQALHRSQERVAALEVRVDRLAAIQDQITRAESDLSEWAMLAKALGREGVQALEIDAAGPEVARLTNELLTSCYGPRFSITFETLATKQDGGQREVFDVQVYDGGAERPVEALSGGERVVISEAIGLAVSIFNSRKGGVKWETLFRDETAGALDPDNAQRYVSMLRHARAMAGAAQIIFVAHQKEVWEAADAQVFVADGVVSVGAAA